MIEEMDANGGGTVDRAEFLSHFLVRMGWGVGDLTLL